MLDNDDDDYGGSGGGNHGNRAETDHHGNSLETSREEVYTPSNGIREDDAERVRLEFLPDGDQVPLVSDGELNKSLDAQHFGTEKDALTQQDGSNDDEEQNRTDNSNPTNQIQGVGTSNSVDINGNSNGSRDTLSDEGRPPGSSEGEQEQGQ